MVRGKFITLEGGEGAGKSTQGKLLGEFLRKKGLDVVLTREVGGSPSAEVIREVWLSQKDKYWDQLTELLLIMAARREHLVKTVFPALERGAWVVSDRFADSTRAYQGIALGLGLEAVEDIYQRIAPNFEPDMTLLLDLPVEQGMRRVSVRAGQGDRFEEKDLSFHQKLRDAYHVLAKKFAHRFFIIDASVSETDVGAKIARTVADRFGL